MPPSEASAPGSIGKNRPWSRRYSLSCLARHAGLDHAVEILGVHREHAVHVAEVERDAAPRRVDVAFERGAGAERDDRHAMPRADAHDLLHVLGRLRKHHRVRRLVRDPGDGVAVLLAHRLRRSDEPVAEALRAMPSAAAMPASIALEPRCEVARAMFSCPADADVSRRPARHSLRAWPAWLPIAQSGKIARHCPATDRQPEGLDDVLRRPFRLVA